MISYFILLKLVIFIHILPQRLGSHMSRSIKYHTGAVPRVIPNLWLCATITGRSICMEPHRPPQLVVHNVAIFLGCYQRVRNYPSKQRGFNNPNSA